MILPALVSIEQSERTDFYGLWYVVFALHFYCV